MGNKLIMVCVILFIGNYNCNSQELERLSSKINSEYDEISPVLSKDGERLYFTRIGYPIFNETIVQHGKRITDMMPNDKVDSLLRIIYTEISGRYIQNPRSSSFNQDIWIAELGNNGKIKEVWHPGYPLNNALPNTVLSIIQNSNELILLNQFDESGYMKEGISSSKVLDNRRFGNPVPIKVYRYGSQDRIINMTTGNDDKYILWSLKRDDSYGGRDLYVSFKIGENLYSAPNNLGSEINSTYRESAPHLSPNGRTIYFSSNRPVSLGGTDIYYARRLDSSWTSWSPIKPMQAPVNSTYDDSQPVPSPDGKYLYFCSRRSGSSDIFRFRLLPDDSIVMKIKIRGVVIDATSNRPIAAELFWGRRGVKKENLPHYFRSATGDFSTQLLTNHSYVFVAEKQGYKPNVVTLNLTDYSDTSRKVMRIRIPLSKKEPELQSPEKGKKYVKNPILPERLNDYKVEKTYILDRIYFKRSKAIVLQKSIPALKELYDVMNSDQGKVILISGHTDNNGPEKLLMELSRDRANVIKAYLMKHGISADRIKTIGYGSTRPLNDNSTEAERKKNRRVEISFLKKK